jgi:hypothetical protein
MKVALTNIGIQSDLKNKYVGPFCTALKFILQDPSEINRDNLNIRHETNRHFRNKKWEYLQDRSNELATNSKNMDIRDLQRAINKFKRSYQPRSNLVKDENGDLLADSHNILNRWKNYS